MLALAKRAFSVECFSFHFFLLYFIKTQLHSIQHYFCLDSKHTKKESLKIAAERSTSMSIRLVCLTRQQQANKNDRQRNKKMIFHNLNASP